MHYVVVNMFKNHKILRASEKKKKKTLLSKICLEGTRKFCRFKEKKKKAPKINTRFKMKRFKPQLNSPLLQLCKSHWQFFHHQYTKFHAQIIPRTHLLLRSFPGDWFWFLHRANYGDLQHGLQHKLFYPTENKEYQGRRLVNRQWDNVVIKRKDQSAIFIIFIKYFNPFYHV